jgi:hypothetical protein
MTVKLSANLVKLLHLALKNLELYRKGIYCDGLIRYYMAVKYYIDIIIT